MTQVKSGKEVLDEFFDNIDNLPNIDKKTAESIIELYRAGKLTQKNLVNALSKEREKEPL